VVAPLATVDPLTCAYCGKPAEGGFAIHRGGFGVGPEVDLCNACGSQETPTSWEIWEQIAQPSEHSFAHVRIRHRKRV